jgi:N-acetylmuramoyl-L-alanine amidase
MLIRSVTKMLVVCLGIILISVPIAMGANDIKAKFQAAESTYEKLNSDSGKKVFRHHWLACIKKYQAVHSLDPSGPFAAQSLFMAGKLQFELYHRSGLADDKKIAKENFEKIVSKHASSPYKEKAAQYLLQITGNVPKPSDSAKRPAPAPNTKIAAEKSAGTEPSKKSSSPSSSSSMDRGVSATSIEKSSNFPPFKAGLIHVSGLRYWSNPTYTRVAIYTEKETPFTHQLIKKDTVNNKPPRLCVDFENSRLSSQFNRMIPINDELLSDARAAQFTMESVRVVIDIKSFSSYKVFSLSNPFRVIVDVWGDTSDGCPQPPPTSGEPDKSGEDMHSKKGTEAAPIEQKAIEKSVPEPVPPQNDSLAKNTIGNRIKDKKAAGKGQPGQCIGPGALAKQLALGVRRIIIDAGHGGKDFGASGYMKGIYEKDVTLRIAKRLAQKIHGTLGCEVILTRTSDRYLALEERTAIANTNNGDLFISIHTNSHRDKRAFGIETYFLNLATDNDSILVAARENATSKKNISDLQAILNDLMKNAKVNESSRLAAYIQTAMCRNLSGRYSQIRNKGVKQAPFYVLLGAQMPAVLIETSFISNEEECERLVNSIFQDNLVAGIVHGIQTYIKEINPTVSISRRQKEG